MLPKDILVITHSFLGKSNLIYPLVSKITGAVPMENDISKTQKLGWKIICYKFVKLFVWNGTYSYTKINFLRGIYYYISL